MCKITVMPQNVILHHQAGNHLLDTLQAAGFLVDIPCGGRGVCGKCKVKVTDGTFPPASDTEIALLFKDELAGNIRLACMLHPESDLVVQVKGEEQGHPVLTDGYLPDFPIKPAVTRTYVTASLLDFDRHRALDERIAAILSSKRIALEALRSLPRIDKHGFTAHCYGDDLLAIECGKSAPKAFGLAVDIGTTTVVAALVELDSGRELAVCSDINIQKEYGLDVLTRITYVLENQQGGLEALRTSIVSLLNKMTTQLCAEADISPAQVYDIAVAANNIMMHLLLGINPVSIGRAPFSPVFCEAQTLPAQLLGLTASKYARLYCLPAVSSYIGADIVAGTYVCGLHREKRNVLFIDIGTNGEIVLAHKGRFLCCSCAAGPALEGMNIRCGMRASNGAIEDVSISDAGIEYKVIGNAPPIGLCGSGILSAISELVRVGIISPSGRIDKENSFLTDNFGVSFLGSLDGKPAIRLAEDVWITQADIRQVQLAKGAILSGFYALLNHAGITMKDLDQVLVAGQFGSHLTIKSIVGCGIIPGSLAEKIAYIGNSSKAGAYVALLSAPARSEMEQLAKAMTYLELSNLPDYEKSFAGCLSFTGAN